AAVGRQPGQRAPALRAQHVRRPRQARPAGDAVGRGDERQEMVERTTREAGGRQDAGAGPVLGRHPKMLRDDLCRRDPRLRQWRAMAVDASWTFDPGAVVLESAALALYVARWRT